MSPTDFPHRRLVPLFLAVLFAGPVACDPEVSRFDMQAAKDRVDALTTRTALLDKQIEDAKKEMKELQSFGGDAHQAKLKMAMVLRAEKTELETLKKELDGRLEKFEKDTARHREELIKLKQQLPPKQP